MKNYSTAVIKYTYLNYLAHIGAQHFIVSYYYIIGTNWVAQALYQLSTFANVSIPP